MVKKKFGKDPKPLIEMDKEGNTIRYFKSGKLAKEEYLITSAAMITLHVQGRIKHCQGHYFRYATETEIAKWEAFEKQVNERETKVIQEVQEVHPVNQPEPEIIKANQETTYTGESLFEKLKRRKRE